MAGSSTTTYLYSRAVASPGSEGRGGGKSWGSGAKPPAGCRAPAPPLGGLERV